MVIKKRMYLLAVCIWILVLSCDRSEYVQILEDSEKNSYLNIVLELVSIKNYRCQLTITNISDTNIKIPIWELFESPYEGNFLNLTTDKGTVEYIGRIIKRAPPTENELIVIQPKETIVRFINLSDLYDIPKKYIKLEFFYRRNLHEDISVSVYSNKVIIKK